MGSTNRAEGESFVISVLKHILEWLPCKLKKITEQWESLLRNVCYVDWIVPPPVHMLTWWYLEMNLWEVIRFRRDHEDGAVMVELETPESSVSLPLTPPPPLIHLSYMREQSEKAAICRSGKESSTEPDHGGTLISDFQPPELLEHKFLLFKHLVYGILIWQPRPTKMGYMTHIGCMKAHTVDAYSWSHKLKLKHTCW